MITEAYSIHMSCDIRGCGAATTVLDVSSEACNMRLYLLGWRMRRRRSLETHLCPACAERHQKASERALFRAMRDFKIPYVAEESR